MLKQKKVLLLIGSPKPKNSTSESLVNYLLEGLIKRGCSCEKIHLLSMLRNNAEELIEKVNTTDVLIIVFPLYVDSLPSPLTKALELITDKRKEKGADINQTLVAISNSGFPESFHNDTALKICKCFASKNNFKWLGGLPMGSGGAINGRPIEQFGGMTRNIVKALDMTTEAIVNDEIIPNEAIEMISTKMFPNWLYTLAGNRDWKTQAKKFNMHKQLYAKPYIK